MFGFRRNRRKIVGFSIGNLSVYYIVKRYDGVLFAGTLRVLRRQKF